MVFNFYANNCAKIGDVFIFMAKSSDICGILMSVAKCAT